MEYLLIALFSILILFFTFNRIVEPLYMVLFHKPVFVHFYLFPKRLPNEYRAMLEEQFTFFRKLPHHRKVYFEHRVNKFINAYNFVGRDGLEVTTDIKIKIAATSVILTFGMRRYLYNVFKTIILYPGIYASPKDGQMHKGEFNPALGVIVFSWPDFEQGLLFGNDNLNLGLHEFAHALHFESLRKRRAGASAAIYRDMYNEIMNYIADPENRNRLIAMNYFRDYAYTNPLEFIAVILEYFFETPVEFKQKFPELYELVRKMINFRE